MVDERKNLKLEALPVSYLQSTKKPQIFRFEESVTLTGVQASHISALVIWIWEITQKITTPKLKYPTKAMGPDFEYVCWIL
jgi:hypothetical protein